MSGWWNALSMFTRLTLLFVIPCAILLILIIVREVLKFYDMESGCDSPKFLSASNLLLYIVIEGTVSMILRQNGHTILFSQLVGLIFGVVFSLLILLVTRSVYNKRKKKLIDLHSGFVGCVGKVVRQVGQFGGSVEVDFNGKRIKSGAIAQEPIKEGETVRIVDYTNGLMTCEKI